MSQQVSHHRADMELDRDPDIPLHADSAPGIAGGGMGERKGSGLLNPRASSFIPRTASGGSDVFLTPAPSIASATALAELTPEQARPYHALTCAQS